MNKKITVTTTGTEEIIMGNDQILTFAAVGDQTDFVCSGEVLLNDDGNWLVAQAAMVDSTLYSTNSGARKFRFNVTNMGTATTIDLEISGANL